MLSIRLDSTVPLTEQIVQGIRRALAAGELEPGDQLPPVRQLAADLGINLNTVARAYRALEASGLVVTARGRGTRVTAARESHREPQRRIVARLVDAVCNILTDAKLGGLDRATAQRHIEEQLDQVWPDSRPGS